jgi:hypothetical protein
MPYIAGKKITREKIHNFPATLAFDSFHPQKVLDMGFLVAADNTLCPIQVPYIFFEFATQRISRFIIGGQIKMLNLLPYDPVGHGIDVETDNVAADSIRFQKRRSSPHERVGNPDFREIIRIVKRFFQRLIGKLRQQKPPKQRARPASKPFVDCDERAIVLLNLFFPQSKVSDK